MIPRISPSSRNPILIRGGSPGLRAQQNLDPIMQRMREIERQVEQEAQESFSAGTASAASREQRAAARDDRMREARLRQREEARARREGKGFSVDNNREQLEAQGINVDQILSDLKAEGIDLERDAGLSMTQLKQREANQREPGGLRDISRTALKRRGGQDEFGGDQSQLQNFGGSIAQVQGFAEKGQEGRAGLGNSRNQSPSIDTQLALEERLAAQRPDEGLKKSYDERRAAQGEYRLPQNRPQSLDDYLKETINESTVERMVNENDQQFSDRIAERREKAAWAIQLGDSKFPHVLQAEDQPIGRVIRDQYGNISGYDPNADTRLASGQDWQGGDWLAQDMGLRQGGDDALTFERRPVKVPGSRDQQVDYQGRPVFRRSTKKATSMQGNATGSHRDLISQIRAKVASGEVSLEQEFNGVPVWKTLENLERHVDGRVEHSRSRAEGRKAVQTASRRMRGEYNESDIDFLVSREARRRGPEDYMEGDLKQVAATGGALGEFNQQQLRVGRGPLQEVEKVPTGRFDENGQEIFETQYFDVRTDATTGQKIRVPANERKVTVSPLMVDVQKGRGSSVTKSSMEMDSLFDRYEQLQPGAKERLIQVSTVNADGTVSINRTDLNRIVNGNNSTVKHLGTKQTTGAITGMTADEKVAMESRLRAGVEDAPQRHRQRMIDNILKADADATSSIASGRMPAGQINATYTSGGSANSGLGSKYDPNVNFGPSPRPATEAVPLMAEGPGGSQLVGFADPQDPMVPLGRQDMDSDPGMSVGEEWVRDHLYDRWDIEKGSFEPPVASNISGTLDMLTKRFEKFGLQFNHSIRGIGDLEAASAALVESRQAQGKPFYRRDEAGNQQLVEDPDITDVLNTIGIKNSSQQKQIARSLNQLEEANLNNVNKRQKAAFEAGEPMFGLNEDGTPIRPMQSAPPRIQPTTTRNAYVNGDPVRDGGPNRLGGQQRFQQDRGATIRGIGNQRVRNADGEKVQITGELARLDAMKRIQAAQDAEIAAIQQEVGRPLTNSEVSAVRNRVFEDLQGYDALVDLGDAQSRLYGAELNDPNISAAQLRQVFQGMTDNQIAYFYQQRAANNLGRNGKPKKGFEYDPQLVALRQQQARELRAQVALDQEAAEARRRGASGQYNGRVQGGAATPRTEAEFLAEQARLFADDGVAPNAPNTANMLNAPVSINEQQVQQSRPRTTAPLNQAQQSPNTAIAAQAQQRSNPTIPDPWDQDVSVSNARSLVGSRTNAGRPAPLALGYGIDTAGPMQGANLGREFGPATRLSQAMREDIRNQLALNRTRRAAQIDKYGRIGALTGAGVLGAVGLDAIADERQAREEAEREALIAQLSGRL